ncbi:MAG: glycosyltransferase family 4 protein [Patescibacteria group bacterium]
MKTLLITLEFPPTHGGVANYYGHLVSNWPIGEDLSILDNNQGELDSKKGFFSWWLSFGALGRKLKRSKIDYVLVGQILPLGTVAYFLSLFNPIKYAVFLHGMDLSYALKSPRKKFISHLILKKSDKIICANSYVAQKTIEAYPELESKIAVVNPGVTTNIPIITPSDISDLKLQYNLESQKIIFTLARLVRRKGIDMTIRALEEMTDQEISNLVYFIAGTGTDEYYLKKMVPERLAQKIIFLGSLSENKKWLWLKLCDIFVMPARDIEGDFEGFGIVYLEANLSTAPVIAGRAGGVEDAVSDGYNGLLVDPINIQEIKNAILKLANDDQLREQLGQQGREQAITKFDLEKQAARIVNLIKQ